MIKRILAFCLAIALLGVLITALAAGEPGSPSNPLITLSYLLDKFTPAMTAEASKLANAALTEKNKQLSPEAALASSPAVINAVSDKIAEAVKGTGGKDVTLTALPGHTLSLGQGSLVVLMSGGAKLSKPAVDLNIGADSAADTALALNRKFLLADSGALMTFSAPSTVLVNGQYVLAAPAYKPKYTDLAQALFDMGLVQGTGRGFELELNVTRVQMVYMTLTLLGERDMADAYTGGRAFTDVPDWAANAMEYAYMKGYTQGVGGTLFDPNRAADAAQFATMLLRVLGYVDGQDEGFTWDRGLEYGTSVGLLTYAEMSGLRELFLRDHLMYMSYYALETRLKGEVRTLEDTLVSRAVLSRDRADTAKRRVTQIRGLR
ncbi:MAG: S-layer homology domain-containing protein [Oscillospiraceae bacterium]|nr:S-layer homology domain-containing protein [Oscillospiraceae bacterium]